MENKKISIVLLGITLCSMLVFADNLEFAYAQAVISNEPFNVATMSSVVYGYASTQDYLITTQSATYYVVKGSDLTAVNSFASGLDTFLSQRNSILCNASSCFVIGQTTGGNLAIERFSLSSFSTTTYVNATWANCSPTSLFLSGTTLYFTLADFGACAFTGIYTISTSFSSGGDNQIAEYDDNINFGQTGSNGMCKVGNFLIRGISNFLYKYNLSNGALTSLDTGASAITTIACDSTHVYLTSNAGNYVKRANISTLTLEADVGSVTAPSNIMARGDSVFVGRSGATTITALSKTDLTSAFVMFTSANNNVDFFVGNSTRLNFLAPDTNDNIFYAMSGILAPELEEEEENNQVDGRCGNGTALDCVGDRGTIDNIFYGTGGTGVPITNVTNNLLDGLGITNSTNDDIQTNGTGLVLMLVTGVFFTSMIVATIAIANNKFNAGIQYTEVLTKEVWLFLVVGVVALSWFLGWIPEIVFYGMVVGLAGLFAFGLYRHFKGSG